MYYTKLNKTKMKGKVFFDLIKKRLLKEKKVCKVYDTSAIRNHFEEFKEFVESNKEILVIVPEGVLHEISVAKRVNNLCRTIYNFITSVQAHNPYFVVEVTEDKIRNWSVDEQVIYVAEKYIKKKYDVELVSCDKEQCFRAELKKVKCNILPVNVPECYNTNEGIKYRKSRIRKFEKNPSILPEIKIEYIVLNKIKYLKLNSYLAVYDRTGKRKIAKDCYVSFEESDRVLYAGVEYEVSRVDDKEIFFKLKQ